MKETFYFSHDYNARNDEKILKLLSGKDSWYSYGLYWAIIEKLYEAGGYLKKDYDCIAFDLRTDSERIANVIESGLFEFINDKFFSKSCLARLRTRKGKSEKARQSAIIRWDKAKKDNANAMRTQCDSYAIKESKVKESKGNISKDINKIDFDIFWSAYKKKIDRPKCEAKWKKLTLEDQKAIIEYIPKYLETIKEKRFQKHPATFLNNRSWENEITPGEIDTTGWSQMKMYEHFGVEGMKKYIKNEGLIM